MLDISSSYDKLASLSEPYKDSGSVKIKINGIVRGKIHFYWTESKLTHRAAWKTSVYSFRVNRQRVSIDSADCQTKSVPGAYESFCEDESVAKSYYILWFREW